MLNKQLRREKNMTSWWRRSGNVVHEVCRAQMTYFDYKSILCIFDCCTIILQLLGKWATEKTVDQSTVHCWQVTWQMTSWNFKCPDVRDEHNWAYCWQRFGYLKQLGNKTIISRLLLGQSNHCPLVVEKIWETVALGLRPLATVTQIFSTSLGQ